MTRKTLFTPAVLVAGLLFLGTIGLVAAHAAPPRPAGGAPVARILMIDMRRVIGESKVGQDIQRQVEAFRRQASGELKGEGSTLQSEKTKLEQQKAILAADVWTRKARDFEAKAEAFQKKIQKRGSLIQGGVIKAQRQVEQALGPVLEGIMRERGATILLDRNVVLLAPNSLDVTEVARQRLDMKMSTVKVELTAPPQGLEQQQQ